MATVNKNSSMPSSQTDKDESSLSKKGSNNKGKKENNTRFSNSRTQETVKLVRVYSCENCGEDLSGKKSDTIERRTLIDIVFEKQVTHVDSEHKACPSCGVTTKGKFPQGMSGPMQYGNGIKAYIISMLVHQMVSLKRVQQAVKTLIGLVISEAVMLKYLYILHESLQDWEQWAVKEVIQSPVINTDETSQRVDKKNHWIHVYSSGDITLKFLHSKRGRDAIEDIGIIPNYTGVIVHDCWSSYLSYSHCQHGLCGSHLLRELTFVIESNEYRWAKNMKKLLKDTCKKVSKKKGKKLSCPIYKQQGRARSKDEQSKAESFRML